MNSNFNSPQKVGSVWARSSLKQLWEKCCAEVDEIAPEGDKELDDRLLSFQGFLNWMKFAHGNSQLGTGEHSTTTPPRRYIPNDWC
jgi:hypothetical protein